MVEKSIFLDRQHSPMIELTKREVQIILYWLGQQADGYWKEGAWRDFSNIDVIYDELIKLVGNRKSQPRKWKWLLTENELKEKKTLKKKLKNLKQRESDKRYYRRHKEKIQSKQREYRKSLRRRDTSKGE